MTLVRIKDKYQITIPSELREQLDLAAGEFLEATVENNKITLTPVKVVDRDQEAAVTDSFSVPQVSA